jgi:hypothetical protein
MRLKKQHNKMDEKDVVFIIITEDLQQEAESQLGKDLTPTQLEYAKDYIRNSTDRVIEKAIKRVYDDDIE